MLINDTVKKRNGQARDWEKIFVICRFDILIYIFVVHRYEFISRTYTKSYKSIKQKNEKPNKEMGKRYDYTSRKRYMIN